MNRILRNLSGILILICVSTPSAKAAPSQLDSATQRALQQLQKGKFDEAERATEALPSGNSSARVIRAIALYKKTMHQFFLDLRTAMMGLVIGNINHRYMRKAFTDTDEKLNKVEGFLASASDDAALRFKLCLACLPVDWDQDGRITNEDQLLFEIEQDEAGKPIPSDDKRRKPTFTFDQGDVYWARAFVRFQQAALNLVLGYKWTELGKAIGFFQGEEEGRLVIRLDDVARIHTAKRYLLDGLRFAERSRALYLTESDDEGEWVPNPQQKNHPMPLPVNSALYATWLELIGDLRNLVEGKEGIDIAELAQLGDQRWKKPPRGYLDIGSMLQRPKDLVFDFKTFEQDWLGLAQAAARDLPAKAERSLRSIFGTVYVKSMKASPITKRLTRMKREIDSDTEPFERKLRYLLWLN